MRFFHGDHLGSVNVVTDASGKVLESTTYTPFGAVSRREVSGSPIPRSPDGPVTRPGFTGQREDTTSGLLLFPARPYDPSLGRFLQPDPFVQEPGDPQSLNRYSYVRNNPLNLVDPSGYRSILKRLKDWFKEEVVHTVVKIFFPATTTALNQEVATRSTQAGYEAAQAGQNPWRAAVIEAAVVYAEYAAAGFVYGVTEDVGEAYRAGQAAGEATRRALQKAWHDAKAVAQDLGVSAGRAAETIAAALVSPQATRIGQGGSAYIGMWAGAGQIIVGVGFVMLPIFQAGAKRV